MAIITIPPSPFSQQLRAAVIRNAQSARGQNVLNEIKLSLNVTWFESEAN